MVTTMTTTDTDSTIGVEEAVARTDGTVKFSEDVRRLPEHKGTDKALAIYHGTVKFPSQTFNSTTTTKWVYENGGVMTNTHAYFSVAPKSLGPTDSDTTAEVTVNDEDGRLCVTFLTGQWYEREQMRINVAGMGVDLAVELRDALTKAIRKAKKVAAVNVDADQGNADWVKA